MKPFPDATAMAQAYGAGHTDPVAELHRALDRVPLAAHAFISLDVARAQREAEADRARWRAGRPLSPFDGVPLAWKDLFDVAGSVTTAGSALRRNHPAARTDAACVARLSAAGMVCLGKTNLSELAFSGLGLNPHFGTPCTPLGLDQPRIAGGSSSGSAVAVAADVVPLAMGTDTAGSIRVPAAFNGLVGLRSSRRRYPRQGMVPLARSFDSIGPLARSVRDVVTLDGLLHQQSRRDCEPGSLPGVTLRVDDAILSDERIAPAVRNNLEYCLTRLTVAGARLDRRPLRAFNETLTLIQTHGWLGALEAFALHRTLLDSPDAERLDPRVRQRLELARYVDARVEAFLYSARRDLQARLAIELSGAALILPTVAHTAPALIPLEEDELLFASVNLMTLWLTMPGSYLDMPGMALPSGRDALGLPTSLLLALPRGEDARLLRLALSVEAALRRE